MTGAEQRFDGRLQALAAGLETAGVYPGDYGIATMGVADGGIYIRREDGVWHVFLSWRMERPFEQTFSDKDAAIDYFVDLLQALRRSRHERGLDRDEFRRRASELGFDEGTFYSFDPEVQPALGSLIEPDGDGWQVSYWERGSRSELTYDATTESEALGFVLEEFERERHRPPPMLLLSGGNG